MGETPWKRDIMIELVGCAWPYHAHGKCSHRGSVRTKGDLGGFVVHNSPRTPLRLFSTAAISSVVSVVRGPSPKRE